MKHTVIVILLLSCNQSLYAKETRQSTVPTVDIRQLISDYATRNNQPILIDPRVKAKVALVGQNKNHIDYSTLLAILYVHGFSAVKQDNLLSIVPDVAAKSRALPIVEDAQGTIDGNELVTATIRLKKIPAAQVIPLLRPLVPQQGHLAAAPLSNSLVITDRYSNIKRIRQLAENLDATYNEKFAKQVSSKKRKDADTELIKLLIDSNKTLRDVCATRAAASTKFKR